MIYVVIGTLALVAVGVIIACVLGYLEYRRIKREQKQMREKFKIDTSAWDI